MSAAQPDQRNLTAKTSNISHFPVKGSTAMMHPFLLRGEKTPLKSSKLK